MSPNSLGRVSLAKSRSSSESRANQREQTEQPFLPLRWDRDRSCACHWWWHHHADIWWTAVWLRGEEKMDHVSSGGRLCKENFPVWSGSLKVARRDSVHIFHFVAVWLPAGCVWCGGRDDRAAADDFHIVVPARPHSVLHNRLNPFKPIESNCAQFKGNYVELQSEQRSSLTDDTWAAACYTESYKTISPAQLLILFFFFCSWLCWYLKFSCDNSCFLGSKLKEWTQMSDGWRLSWFWAFKHPLSHSSLNQSASSDSLSPVLLFPAGVERVPRQAGGLPGATAPLGPWNGEVEVWVGVDQRGFHGPDRSCFLPQGAD